MEEVKLKLSERLRCGTIQKQVSYILQLMTADTAKRILPFYHASDNREDKRAVTMAAKSG